MTSLNPVITVGRQISVTAYEALSPVMRAFVDGLRGMHRFAPPPGVDETPEYRELMRKRTLVSEHPIVRVHP